MSRWPSSLKSVLFERECGVVRSGGEARRAGEADGGAGGDLGRRGRHRGERGVVGGHGVRLIGGDAGLIGVRAADRRTDGEHDGRRHCRSRACPGCRPACRSRADTSRSSSSRSRTCVPAGSVSVRRDVGGRRRARVRDVERVGEGVADRRPESSVPTAETATSACGADRADSDRHGPVVDDANRRLEARGEGVGARRGGRAGDRAGVGLTRQARGQRAAGDGPGAGKTSRSASS